MATHDISLMGAVFPGVPKVILPVDGGGTATFTDVSDTTAAAADGASGKYFYTADGTKTAGTASGGGGGGLVYETGTYTPASDIAKPTISFANTHSTMPMFIMMEDTTETYDSTTNSMYAFNMMNYYGFTNATMYYSSTGKRYANGLAIYRSSNASSITQSTISITHPPTDTTDNSNSYYRYFMSEAWFKPCNTSTYYWRSGRTYKWIAVWAPTT